MNDELNTIPKLFRHHARHKSDHIAYRNKDLGIWHSWSWREAWEEVKLLALGLQALGFGANDRLLIVGENRPWFYWAMVAAQSLGGTPVPAYQDGLPDDYAYILANAGAKFAFAENQEFVDKLLLASETNKTNDPKTASLLEHIIYDDARGLRDYQEASLISYESLKKLGAKGNRTELKALIDAGKPDDVAVIPYTSGTTGQPKGVVLTFANILITAEKSNQFDHISGDEDILSYLPMAWIGDHIFSIGQAITAGFCVNCPEQQSTVKLDMREIGPSYFFAPPRVFENHITDVTIRMEDASLVKKALYRYFMKIAERVGVEILDGKSVGLLDRLLYRLGDLLIYAPLKDALGMGRIRLAYTAGEAIGPEIFRFYRALGVNLKQLYGQTEAAVFIAMQPDGEIYADTVGPPAPWVEIKIAEDGELLYRSPGVFREYLGNPEATQKTRHADGWVHSGDAGYILPNGHLRIIDRAKDVGKLANGHLFAPKYIENKLKFFANIREAVVFGAKKDYVTAFINIDLQAVGNWAERQGLAYASYQELSQMPEVARLICDHIAKVNQDLRQDPQMAASQIRRFLVLPKELDADDGEMTRTRKVRRNIIDERYSVLIQGLYDQSTSVDLALDVVFEDGRRGHLKGAVGIYSIDAEG